MLLSQDRQEPLTNISQKLQKALAIQGLGSRRAIEKWIQAGRFTVNGQIATLGVRVSLKDKITLDGKTLALTPLNEKASPTKLLLYYKPPNEICSAHDPQGRCTVFEKLPSVKPARWVMLGRLDFNTLGLLLFTTDGLLSHRLLHPRYEIEREYAVRVHGGITAAMLRQLQEGVLLDGKVARFASITTKPVSTGANQWYNVIIKEGRQREVRRLWETQGVTVSRLMRIRFGPIVLPAALKPGQFMWLPDTMIAELKRCVGLHT